MQLELHLQHCIPCSQNLQKANLEEDRLVQLLRVASEKKSGLQGSDKELVIWAIVSGPEIPEIRFPVTRELEFGRQTSRERECPFFCEGTDSDRAIIAPAWFRTLSRKHLLVKPLTSRQLQISCLTTKGVVVINNFVRLQPGESCQVSLPAEVWLGQHRIQLISEMR